MSKFQHKIGQQKDEPNRTQGDKDAMAGDAQVQTDNNKGNHEASKKFGELILKVDESALQRLTGFAKQLQRYGVNTILYLKYVAGVLSSIIQAGQREPVI